MHPITRHVLALLCFSFLAGCATSPQIGAYQRAIREAGFSAYNQPVGDVHNVNDWNKFGPGVILRTKTQGYYFSASSIIGPSGVQRAMDPQNASPIGLFSGRRVSGYDFDGHGGWTLDAVNQISASLTSKHDTTVELQFGKSYVANPMSESDMHHALARAGSTIDPAARKALRNGQFTFVQNAIWTESIRYTFKQTTENGVSATYKLSAQEIAALTAKGYKIIDGGVQVDAPTFIAYTPLPNPAQDLAPAR